MQFDANEKFYRAVKPEGIYIKSDGSISSAAFKDSNGCSVDYGCGRTDKEAANFMLKKLSGNVYYFYFNNCLERDIFVNYEPVSESSGDANPYHCCLYKNSSLERMTSSQCKYLATIANMVPVSS